MTPKSNSCCGISLRPLCFMIGYLHLASSVVDVVCHLLTVAIVTNGFQCDVNNESKTYHKFSLLQLQAISIPWLEPLLIVLNLGTHVQKYTKALRLETAATQNIEKPPSYIECLINGHVRPPSYEVKEEVVIVDEERKQNIENAEKS
ncbi:hypothetical protein HF086_012392 [Spodoptera exigua]|uniref:Uncharacterized protein n=1 Tax=Spodoptera exigua TaxID=7107 RepID=A0A922SCH8_SPOEX|nr:hypothetical protein HF086_012392 [Spodoptera exigua]